MSIVELQCPCIRDKCSDHTRGEKKRWRPEIKMRNCGEKVMNTERQRAIQSAKKMNTLK